VRVTYINDGGAAFPCAMSDQTYGNQDGAPFQAGMALRDWFAGQALIGLLAHATSAQTQLGLMKTFQAHGMTAEEGMTVSAYQFADAMLAAREKGNA
jgi:hypothetical protein